MTTIGWRRLVRSKAVMAHADMADFMDSMEIPD
jgi:hypothetical protein